MAADDVAAEDRAALEVPRTSVKGLLNVHSLNWEH
jgi:hypothetical protein